MTRLATKSTDELTHTRDRICQLVSLQAELRRILKQDLERSQKPLAAYEREIGFGFGKLTILLNGQKVFCGDQTLKALEPKVGKHLVEQIRSVADKLTDRQRGLAVCPLELIAFAFSLKQAFYSLTDANTRAFCALFGLHGDLVSRVLADDVTAVLQCANPDIRSALETALNGDWRERYAALSAEQLRSRQQQAKEFATLYRRLRPRFSTAVQLAKALGVHSTTCTSALKGEVAIGTYLRLTERALTLLGDRKKPHSKEPMPSVAPGPPAAQPPPTSSPPTNDGNPTLGDVLNRHGGVTSDRGVPFVLTAASFQPISGDPGDAFIRLLQQYIQLVRALLNIAAQIQDEAARDRIRKILVPEVEELHNAIGVFSFANPSALTELFDVQRRAMETVSASSMAPTTTAKRRGR